MQNKNFYVDLYVVCLETVWFDYSCLWELQIILEIQLHHFSLKLIFWMCALLNDASLMTFSFLFYSHVWLLSCSCKVVVLCVLFYRYVHQIQSTSCRLQTLVSCYNQRSSAGGAEAAATQVQGEFSTISTDNNPFIHDMNACYLVNVSMSLRLIMPQMLIHWTKSRLKNIWQFMRNIYVISF